MEAVKWTAAGRKTAQESQLEPFAPIAFKNREYPRIRAKSRETLGVAGGIRGGSGMFVGIGTAEGPHQSIGTDRRRTAGWVSQAGEGLFGPTPRSPQQAPERSGRAMSARAPSLSRRRAFIAHLDTKP